MFLAYVRLGWKVIAGYKHSSLFCLVISDKEKKFYNIDTWQQKAFELEEFGQVSPMSLFFGCKDEESDFLRNETDLLVTRLFFGMSSRSRNVRQIGKISDLAVLRRIPNLTLLLFNYEFL